MKKKLKCIPLKKAFRNCVIVTTLKNLIEQQAKRAKKMTVPYKN